MAPILMNLHIIIFLWACWQTYEVHTKNEGAVKTLQAKLKKSKKALKKKQKDIEVVKQYENQREEASKQFAEVEAEFEVIRKKLPSTFNHIENKQMFIDIANKLNVKKAIVDDNKLKEENRDFYFIKKYKLSGAGTFLQFLILLERVSESERLFNINSLTFKEKPNSARGRFSIINSEIIVEAYRYNEKYKSKAENKAKSGKKKKKKKKKKRRRRKKKK
jgi:Tfp pilus assembly protein PilO